MFTEEISWVLTTPLGIDLLTKLFYFVNSISKEKMGKLENKERKKKKGNRKDYDIRSFTL